jgi:hypothetical protein
MHSCWGIFCFVLTSFGLNLVVLEFLFENDFEIEKKERKRKKKKQNNASPSLGFGLATQSLARPSSHSLPHSAHSLSRPNRARASPSQSLAAGPRPSALPFLLPGREPSRRPSPAELIPKPRDFFPKEANRVLQSPFPGAADFFCIQTATKPNPRCPV